MKNHEKVAISLQMNIWEAEWFLEQGIKPDFWRGKMLGLKSGLHGLKILGIDLSVLTGLSNPYK